MASITILQRKNPNADLWSSPTVYQMLHNQLYVGDMVQGRHKKVSYKSEKTIWLPQSQWIVVENTHEAIIDRGTFETVQMMLKERTRSGGKGTIHPLAKKSDLRMLWQLHGTNWPSAKGGWDSKTLCSLPDAPAHRKCVATRPVQI